jgi:hypothetical protein
MECGHLFVTAASAITAATACATIFYFHHLLFPSPSNARIYVGSSSINYPGWVGYTRAQLDVTKRDHFKRLRLAGADAFLSEHTFEHIPYEVAEEAFRLFHEFLKPGGHVRTAVPLYPLGKDTVVDAGDRRIGHIAFYNDSTLTALLRRAGFRQVQLLELPHRPEHLCAASAPKRRHGRKAAHNGTRPLDSTGKEMPLQCCSTRYGTTQLLAGPIRRTALFDARNAYLLPRGPQLPAALWRPMGNVRPGSSDAPFVHVWAHSCSLIVDAVKDDVLKR